MNFNFVYSAAICFSPPTKHRKKCLEVISSEFNVTDCSLHSYLPWETFLKVQLLSARSIGFGNTGEASRVRNTKTLI